MKKEKVLVLAEDTLGGEQDDLSVEPKLKTERKTKKNKFIIDTLNLESLDMDSSEAANETTTKPFEYEVDLEQLRTQFADESVKKADKEKKKSKKKREQSKDVNAPKTSKLKKRLGKCLESLLGGLDGRSRVHTGDELPVGDGKGTPCVRGLHIRTTTGLNALPWSLQLQFSHDVVDLHDLLTFISEASGLLALQEVLTVRATGILKDAWTVANTSHNAVFLPNGQSAGFTSEAFLTVFTAFMKDESGFSYTFLSSPCKKSVESECSSQPNFPVSETKVTSTPFFSKYSYGCEASTKKTPVLAPSS
ncbi:hypothetical protein HF325_003962 [Metschnikowia pulcherrima]|uniref:Uncharacterized protein n=1 Tax=Metschnikowia pulcherrima TaxID=27326 RepID=A0A8H7GS39_9ASCO|nr:hypothetical protein HF325_003962 [Metschnikowia pulcherrima]